MKFQTGHWYHWITAIVFVVIAVWMSFSPGNLREVPANYRYAFIGILLVWALFRGLNGYWIYKRKKYENAD